MGIALNSSCMIFLFTCPIRFELDFLKCEFLFLFAFPTALFPRSYSSATDYSQHFSQDRFQFLPPPKSSPRSSQPKLPPLFCKYDSCTLSLNHGVFQMLSPSECMCVFVFLFN